MLSLQAILEIVSGVLKFPGEVLALIRVLQGTPAEQQSKIMEAIARERDSLEKTGRPTWD